MFQLRFGMSVRIFFFFFLLICEILLQSNLIKTPDDLPRTFCNYKAFRGMSLIYVEKLHFNIQKIF